MTNQQDREAAIIFPWPNDMPLAGNFEQSIEAGLADREKNKGITKPLGLQHADKLDTMNMHMTAAEIRHLYKSHAELLEGANEFIAYEIKMESNDLYGAMKHYDAASKMLRSAIANATKGEA